MPFQFRFICDLLESLENVQLRHPPYLPKDVKEKSRGIVSAWFRTRQERIRKDTDGVAFLSLLLVDTTTELVFGIKETGLEKVIARALGLSTSRCADLKRWRVPGAGDLGDCVERVHKQTVRC
jgi:DNA ligase-4